MPLSSSPDGRAPDDDADLLIGQSRRLITAMAGVMVLVIVVSAWYVGDRQDFIDQLSQPRPSTSALPQIGEPAPDIMVTIIDKQGDPIDRVRLSGFEGQPVWLNFWGSWCQPCRAEMPEIQASYEELAPRGLVWLAVSLDEPAENAAELAALNDATFTIASDPDRADIGASYPIAYFPTHILIDDQGIVRDIVIAPLDEEEIVDRAEQILVEPK